MDKFIRTEEDGPFNIIDEEINALLKKIPDEMRILIFAYDNKENILTGLGCKGCAFDLLIALALQGSMKHNEEELKIDLKTKH